MSDRDFHLLGGLSGAPIALLFALAAAAVLAGCNNQPKPSDEQLRQQAAQATERAKEGTKQAVQDARTAAGNAENAVNAVTSGIQDGMKGNGHDTASPTNINTASQFELALLPGISLSKAKEIQDHRPYTSARQLVSRGVLSESEYAAISSKLTTR